MLPLHLWAGPVSILIVYSQYQRKIYIFQRAVQTEIQGLRLCLAACHALLRPGLSPPIVLMLLLFHQ